MILLIVFLFILLHMCLIWLWQLKTQNPSVIDVGWAMALTISGLIYLSAHPLSSRNALLAFALIAWGARLGGYLWWTRVKHRHIDPRYLSLSESWRMKKSIGFFLNAQFQGLLIFVIALPWYFIALRTHLVFLATDYMGIALFTFALYFETKADMELSHFKKIHPHCVCNQGLWRFSRHPNYFFEWLVWCSFALFATPAPYGMIAWVSPLTLLGIMRYVTIPITERQSIHSKGQAYIQYQLKTSAFLPWVRKN